MMIHETIRVKYIGEDDPLALRNGKIYTARVLKKNWYGVVDETNEEYAYPPELFEIVGTSEDNGAEAGVKES